ncbi:MAG: glycosyltransferase family 4 protein [Candidatus Woesearchaeota archaeon]
MKVCWITSLPPKHSGIAIYSSSLLTELHKKIRVKVIPWNYDTWFSKILSPLRNIFQLRKALLEYDIVHVQYILGEMMFLFLPILCALSIKKNAKIVLTCHEDYSNLAFSKVIMLFHDMFYQCADLIMVHTSNHKMLLAQRLHKRTIIIPFGTQPQPISSAGNNSTILLPGFINPWKGHDIAVKAVSIVRKAIPKVQLVIVGKAYDKIFTEKVRQMIKSLGLTGNIQMRTEFVSDDEYKALLRNSYIAILPYRRTTMSAVLSDVVGNTLPCIISDLPTFREYTRNKAIYCKPNDHVDLAKKIVLLLKDSQLRKMMANNFKNLVKEYGWTKVASQTLKQYIVLLGKS